MAPQHLEFVAMHNYLLIEIPCCNLPALPEDLVFHQQVLQL